MRIRARKLRRGSLFKLIFIGTSASLIPFTLLCGIASVFGAHTVTVNDRPVTGIMGLMASLILGPVLCIMFSAVMWVGFVFGLWIYSMFREIELEFVDGEVVE